MPLAPPLVHLVRHGEVHNPDHVNYAALPGFRLSVRGIGQAAAAARRLAERPVAAVTASPLERAQQTAAAIAAAHGLAAGSDPDLTEWGLSEVWAGTRWSEIDPGQLEAYRAHPWDLPFSPESLAQLADRMAGAVRRLHAAHPDGDVVVVGHQDPIQAARLTLTGRALTELADDKPGHCSIITLDPGADWVERGHWRPPETA